MISEKNRTKVDKNKMKILTPYVKELELEKIKKASIFYDVTVLCKRLKIFIFISPTFNLIFWKAFTFEPTVAFQEHQTYPILSNSYQKR